MTALHDEGQVKIYFVGPNGELIMKFYENINTKCDTFQFFLTTLNNKLGRAGDDNYMMKLKGKFDHDHENEAALFNPITEIRLK